MGGHQGIGTKALWQEPAGGVPGRSKGLVWEQRRGRGARGDRKLVRSGLESCSKERSFVPRVVAALGRFQAGL